MSDPIPEILGMWPQQKLVERQTPWVAVHNTDIRSLKTGMRSEKCVFRRLRRRANVIVYLHKRIQGVTGGMCETSGECSLC